MKNPLTIRIETRMGVVIILVWATIFSVVVIRAASDFSNFLVLLDAETPIARSGSRVEHGRIDRWLLEQGLNDYGDAPDTLYAGGTPLFDEETGKPIDRYAYLMGKFPGKPWAKRK